MEYIRTPKVPSLFFAFCLVGVVYYSLFHLQVENVRLQDKHSRHSTNGTLYLTATHLIFVDSTRKEEMWLVHSHIQNVEKLSLSQNGSPLRIR